MYQRYTVKIGLDKFLEGEHTGDVVPEDEVEVHVDERLDVVSPPVWLPRHRERQRRAKLPRSLETRVINVPSMRNIDASIPCDRVPRDRCPIRFPDERGPSQ